MLRDKVDTFQDLVKRADAGELRGHFSTYESPSDLENGLQLALVERPWNFSGRVNPIYWIGRILVVVKILGSGVPRLWNSAKLPQSAEERARLLADTKREHAHFGGWNSMAGRMLMGVQGRSRCCFTENYVLVTDQEVLVSAITFSEKHAQITFRAPLTDIAWTRKPRQGYLESKCTMQFGFTDGSWQTLKMGSTSSDLTKITELFPQTLPGTETIPDAFAGSPGSQGDRS
ncbi:hypothetical protein ACIREE_36665 [Streptomyces sp. NPDC102467]|uniref:hypothetical protein n=1 Tax=Streptomyces sp. NPDC102467 TaxID=3366179 RepID=UPI00381BF53A